MQPGNFQRSGRGGVRLIAASIFGTCVVLGAPGVASAQSDRANSAAENNRSGGMRMTMPRMRMKASGSAVGGAGRVMMPRTTPSQLPFTFRGRRLPATTPSRIGTSYSPNNRNIPIIQREPVFIAERPEPLPARVLPTDPNGIRVRGPDGSPLRINGTDFFVQPSTEFGEYRLPQRLIAVPEDVPRTEIRYSGECTVNGIIWTPYVANIDFSALPKIEQRRWWGTSRPERSDRSFVGAGTIVGEEGEVVSQGRLGGWSSKTVCGPTGCSISYTLHAPAVEEVDPILLAGLVSPSQQAQAEPDGPVSILDCLLEGIVPRLGEGALSEISDDMLPDQARAIALSVILNGHTREGMLALARVYRNHPDLASDPLSVGGPEVQRELSRAVSRAMSAANRESTPSMWLAAAAMVQHAPGRGDVLKRSLDRASRAGLFGALAETSSWKGL